MRGEAVAGHDDKAEYIFSTRLAIVYIEPGQSLGKQGEIPLFTLPAQGDHILCSGAGVFRAGVGITILVEAVHVVQLQATVAAGGAGDAHTESGAVITVERRFQPGVVALAIQPETRIPAPFGLLVGICHRYAVELFGLELVHQSRALERYQFGTGGAVFGHVGRLVFTDRECDRLQCGGNGQFIQRTFGVGAVPFPVAELAAGIEPADIPDALDGEVIQRFGLGTQTETPPFVVVVAVSFHAVIAAGGVEITPLVLATHFQGQLLQVGILCIIALCVKYLERILHVRGEAEIRCLGERSGPDGQGQCHDGILFHIVFSFVWCQPVLRLTSSVKRTSGRISIFPW